MNKTALHAEHVKLGAKMTDFHGWDMPLYYGSILEEHASVRNAAAIFDISHMGQVRVQGSGALSTLNELLVSDITQVGEGRACYSLLLNERGGIVDDIIAYRLASDDFLVIINCGNRANDVAWLTERRQPNTTVRHVSDGRSILAIQGPRSAEILQELLGVRVAGLGRFGMMALSQWAPETWIARTGYTGSDGFELFLPDQDALRIWQRFLEIGRPQGAGPAGLGARDTLRLEAGLRLYGTDMDEMTTPYEADLGWTVAIRKPSFLGKDAIERQQAQGIPRRLIGFELAEGPVPRHGCAIAFGDRTVGTVTSGTFSLMLNKPIGLGYVEPALAKAGTVLSVVIRGKPYAAKAVKLPFWKPTPAAPVPAGTV